MLDVGDQFGPYRVDGLLGRGGMGQVVRCVDQRLERTVAVKIVAPEVLRSRNGAERFAREARLLASVQHPNVVALHHFELESEVGPYLVMEYLEGEDLGARLQRGPLPEEQALPILAAVASALAAVHATDLVHRDLKPANVVLCADAVRLVDFGLARLHELSNGPTGEALTRAGDLLGTPNYMGPEQLRGEPVTAAADLWAFGCLAFEVLTGRRAFEGKTPALVTRDVLAGRGPALDELASHPEVRDLVGVCLRTDPAERTLTAADIAARLGSDDRALADLPTLALHGSASDCTPDSSAALREARRAMDQGRWRAAADAFAAAEAGCRLDGTDLEAWAWAERWASDYQTSTQIMSRAERAYARADEPANAARCASFLGLFHGEQLRPALARGCLARARRLLEDLPIQREHGICYAVAAGVIGTNLSAESARLAEQAVEIGRELDDPTCEAMGQMILGHVAMAEGRYDEGIALHEECAGMALSGQLEPFATGWIYCSVLYGCRAHADWDRASQYSVCANDWCDEHSIGYFPGLCRTHRAEVLRFQGQLDEAQREVRNAQRQLLRANPFALSLAFREESEIAFRQGRFDDARAACERTRAVGRDCQPVHAWLLARDGRPDAAIAALDQHLQDPMCEKVHILPSLARLALQVGDDARAAGALEEYRQVARGLGTPAPLAELEALEGEILAAAGELTAAARHLRKALSQWSALGAPWESAQVRRALAAVLARDGDPAGAGAQLDAAILALERLGAEAAAREARSARDQLTSTARGD